MAITYTPLISDNSINIEYDNTTLNGIIRYNSAIKTYFNENMYQAFNNFRTLALNLQSIPFKFDYVKNMSKAFYDCRILTGFPPRPNNATNIAEAFYNCRNITGAPYCGPNVTNMLRTYYECQNLTGSPMCGDNVTDMFAAYTNCRNITGSPVCGNSVRDMRYAYANCIKLTGNPVCKDSVVEMSYAYNRCDNLTGSPVCGNNVYNFAYTYESCTRLKGIAIAKPSVVNMTACYRNCRNLSGAYIEAQVTEINNIRNAFNGIRPANTEVNFNIIITNSTTYDVIASSPYNALGCQLTLVTSPTTLECGGINYTVSKYGYNDSYRIKVGLKQ